MAIWYLYENTPYLTHHNQKTRKFQISSTKQQINFKYQAPNNKQLLCVPFEILNIGIWILFVIWDLRIVI